MESEQLAPQLRQAQKALEIALEEACNVDLSRVDTGELIRIEETLAAASQAAKEAVSMRLRMRSERAKRAVTSAIARRAEPTAPHRIFEDVRGKRWHAFAVHSSDQTVKRTGLPESFRQGWLVFESDDELRRVAPIPDKWEELPSDQLQLLCHRAAAAPRRTPPLENGPSHKNGPPHEGGPPREVPQK